MFHGRRRVCLLDKEAIGLVFAQGEVSGVSNCKVLRRFRGDLDLGAMNYAFMRFEQAWRSVCSRAVALY